jgi:hypothetical protein
MGSQILGWANVVMDTAEVVALGAVLWFSAWMAKSLRCCG